MKTLLVLRHAKAKLNSPSGSDFDRPLTGRGHRDSAAIGRQLLAGNRRVSALFASPAVRVVETVAGVVEGARLTIAPVWDRRLYNASFETLIACIGEISDAIDAALIVGHNPGLHQLVLDLAEGDHAGLGGQINFSFPTATLADLSLSVDHWRDVAPGCGRLVSLVRPE